MNMILFHQNHFMGFNIGSGLNLIEINTGTDIRSIPLDLIITGLLVLIDQFRD